MNLRRYVFQAIADPTPRVILLLLTSKPMTAGAIASNYGTAIPSVSKRLQIPTECEILRQEGRKIHYFFKRTKRKKMADFVEPFGQM